MKAMKELKEGVDYVVTPEEFVEFTAKYLLDRGECCHNNCKNCPYPDCWCKQGVREK